MGVAPMVANRAVRREVGTTRHKVEDEVLEIEMSPAWSRCHQFCAAFLWTECASSAGRGGGRGQDWSRHRKKMGHSPGEGKRGKAMCWALSHWGDVG